MKPERANDAFACDQIQRTHVPGIFEQCHTWRGYGWIKRSCHPLCPTTGNVCPPTGGGLDTEESLDMGGGKNPNGVTNGDPPGTRKRV